LSPPGGSPLARVTGQPSKRKTKEHDMALFMDFHEDLKLPPEAIAQIADDTRAGRADQFGVRQVELYHNPDGRCTACSKDRTRTPSASTTPRSASHAAMSTR
jgi:hypothetical protein